MSTEIVKMFPLDLNNVIAPYVAKPFSLRGTNDIVTKYEIRLTQPNKEYIETDTLHSIEHLLYYYMNKYFNNIISVNPIGCQTGFYIIVLNNDNYNNFINMLEKCLKDILKTSNIPQNNPNQCARYKNHNLNGALKILKKFLDKRNEWEKIYQ